MKSVLEEIYYGNAGNYEEIKESEKYWNINKKYSALFDKLTENLNDEHKKILEDLYMESCGLEDAASLIRFKEGFKLGMLIAFEVLS